MGDLTKQLLQLQARLKTSPRMVGAAAFGVWYRHESIFTNSIVFPITASLSWRANGGGI
jgi:hypothetical protein